MEAEDTRIALRGYIHRENLGLRKYWQSLGSESECLSLLVGARFEWGDCDFGSVVGVRRRGQSRLRVWMEDGSGYEVSANQNGIGGRRMRNRPSTTVHEISRTTHTDADPSSHVSFLYFPGSS